MKTQMIVCLVTGLIFLRVIPAFSQWSDTSNNYSTGSLYIGSSQDSTYSHLTLRGPNRPFFEESKRDIVFSFNIAGKSIIRAFRGDNWGTYMQFITTSHENSAPVQHVRMHIDEHGRVGIGTVTPGYELTVKGKIQARELLLDINAGADFVFDPNYALPSLSQVKAFIQEKGHLPDIPSQDQMKKEGVSISQFQILLLQKIEELTLHCIRQQEQISSLEKELQRYRHLLDK